MSSTTGLRKREQLRQFFQTPPTACIVLALVLLAILVRMPGVARPLLGNFATKNVIYAMIARNWATGASSMWYPALDCRQGDGLGLHMIEFPVAAYVAGGFWRMLGGSLDVWGRLLSIAAGAGAVAILYLLARRYHSQRAAIAAAVVLALAPASIIYGQAFMLEASLVFFALATVYALERWIAAPRGVWLLALAVSFALALLTKIYLLVLLLPLAAMLMQAAKSAALSKRQAAAGLAALLVATTPAALWYWHAARTAAPDGPLADRVFYSVRDSASVHAPPHPLLSEPRFYGRVVADLASVVLTPIGLACLLLGLGQRDARRWLVWLFACGLLMALLPRKFYEMNYYYLAVLPPLSLIAGLGWERLHALVPRRRLLVAIAAVGVLCSPRYAIRPAFVTPAEDRGVLPAALAIQQLTRANEPIVAMHGSTLDLLYYSGRRGWFVAPDDPQLAEKLARYRRQGARLLVEARRTLEGGPAIHGLPVVESGQQFAVYRLPRDLTARTRTAREAERERR